MIMAMRIVSELLIISVVTTCDILVRFLRRYLRMRDWYIP